jgi:hypothetical protein
VSDGVSFEKTQITHLVDAITKASGPAVRDVAAVVAKGANNIKRDAARRISGHPRFRGLPSAINYDLYNSLKGPAAEIGPDHARRQGQFGGIAEYGSPTSPPLPYMAPAGEAEEPKFAKAIEDLAVKALGLE